MKRIAIAAGLLAGSLCATGDGAAMDELRVQRRETFEWEQEPSVSQTDDTVTIVFTPRAHCDVTVAVEDARGRIVRHLAAGVLGPSAPPPLIPDQLRQKIVWDGKNDQGRYIDDRQGYVVRVSLGLQAVFERLLFRSPKRRIQKEPPLIQAAADGVYVFQGRVTDRLTVFDHAGEYRRTVYPFPARHLASFAALHWHSAPPDGPRVALKEGFHQATLLSSGDNAGFDETGVDRHGQDRLFPHADAASFMTLHTPPAAPKPVLTLGKLSLNRFASDGSAADDIPLRGPAVTVAHPTDRQATPLIARRAAVAPDGRHLYLTAFRLPDGAAASAPRAPAWLPAVYRVNLDSDAKPALWIGNPDVSAATADDRAPLFPTSLACDRAGRLYVTDYARNRLLVYGPDGQWLRHWPAERPLQVMIHARTQAIYVFSGLAYGPGAPADNVSVATRLMEWAPFDQGAQRRAVYDFPASFADRRDPHYRGAGLPRSAALDSWTEHPTFWLAREWAPQDRWGWRADYSFDNIQLVALRNGALETIRDFGADVRRDVVRESSAPLLRRRLHVNPATGFLYVAEGDSGAGKSFRELVEIDPASGRTAIVPLPFDAEDMAIGADGYAYLRTDRMIVRYDLRTWQEIPWDYGEEGATVGDAGDRTGRSATVMAGLPLPSRGFWHHGGLSVSVHGRLLASCYVMPRSAPGWRRDAGADEKIFQPDLYAGRAYGPRSAVLHVWDRHGHRRRTDPVKGLGVVHGVALDRDDNIYVLASATRIYDGQRYFNRATGTLVKFGPEGGRLLGDGPLPVPLDAATRPRRAPDLFNSVGGNTWVEGAAWLYGGIGFAGDLAQGASRCSCANMRFALDGYGRSFVPESGRYSVGVLDTGGNLILRLGRYGNADDGLPLHGAVAGRARLGGDEIALFHPDYLAVDSDRRLFIADSGNDHIVAVRLQYHREVRLPLDPP
jgi:hypothetical protein